MAAECQHDLWKVLSVILIYIPSDSDHKVCRLLIAQVAYIVTLGNSSESAPLEPPDCVGSRDFFQRRIKELFQERMDIWCGNVVRGPRLCLWAEFDALLCLWVMLFPRPPAWAGPWRPHIWTRLYFWVVASAASPFRWMFLFGCSTQCWNLMSPTPSCLLPHFSPHISSHLEQCLGSQLSHQACFQAFWASLYFFEGPLYVLFHFWNLLWHTLWLTSTGVSE